MAPPIRDPARLFAVPEVHVETRADGTVLLRSPQILSGYPRCLGVYLEHWARVAANRPFVLERSAAGDWAGVNYAAALERVQSIATWLLLQNLSTERPVAILSDNSVQHALLMLAAMHVGIPAVSISPAYSLMSKDFAKLKILIARVSPGVVYVEEHQRFAPALAAVASVHDAVVVTGSGEPPAGAHLFAELLRVRDVAAVQRAFAQVTGDSIAKILFTSGSTAEPKGVINTQRMLCSSQQAKAQVWPFLAQSPPVVVDWLPWNHTFGGNHNFNLILRHGGTLYIDAGRPVPQLFAHTVRNLRDIAPTIYFNVPRGYDLLVRELRNDASLRNNFFSRLQLIFTAAAALPQHLWDALKELAHDATGEHIPLVSAWGATETSPLATDCHFQAERSGVIGLPVPGCELKLVRNGNKQEIRVRGSNVTSGYWKQPELAAQCFDDEGFYRIGDAVRFVDAAHPEQGLVFDGRVREDFKLASGTWVNVGTLRVRAIAALAPIAQDIVVAGHDREEIGLLIFPDIPTCRRLSAELPADAPLSKVLVHPAVRAQVAAGLAALLRDQPGSSAHATCALLLSEAPSIDAGEITDKGYINQRAVLDCRAALIEKLYADDSAVIACPILDPSMPIQVDPCRK